MNDNDDILIAEDWWLKPSLLPTNVWSYDKGKNGGYVADFANVVDLIVSIGYHYSDHITRLICCCTIIIAF